jgi:hypothetical protein
MQGVEMMYTTTNHAAAAPTAMFPPGLDMHWETETRVVWNQQERADEEQELIYEVSWIPEIGVWRRFLRSRRKI